jgi:tRNA wybutosine-synthesizing protein 3
MKSITQRLHEQEKKFEQQKKAQIERIGRDKSSIGSIDKQIKELVGYINTKENYYTTSSCSGRIVIINKPTSSKYDVEWLLVSHESLDKKGIQKVLEIKWPDTPTWLMYESTILHICAKTIDAAENLIDLAREVGFKRAGYFSIKKRIIVEIFGTEKIETLIADKEKLIVSETYISRLITEANKKLKKNHKRIRKYQSLLKNIRILE